MDDTLKLILNKLDVIQNDVTDLKTDVSGLKTDVTDLKTDVAGLKTDVAMIKAELTEFKEETRESLANLTKQVDVTAIHVFRHTEKLEEISTDIDFFRHKDYEVQKEIFFLKQRQKVSGG